MLTVFVILILAACVGFLRPEGLWSNAVRMVCVFFSALLATTYFEPLAAFLDTQAPSYTYFFDFLALWLLFAVGCGVLRGLTDVISRVKVRFPPLAEQIGSSVFALLTGWILVCFTIFSLNTAPLGATFLGGGFRSEVPGKFLGLAPDHQWLALVQGLSRGAFYNGSRDNPRTFDPDSKFLPTYYTRRVELESLANQTGAFRKP